MKYTKGSESFIATSEMNGNQTPGSLINNLLLEAAKQARFTCGVYECAQLLETTPDEIMICVLPNISRNDFSVNIQHTLIEAYCWENDIQVVHVDSADKLATLLKAGNNKGTGINKNQDLSCVLVRYPEGQSSDEEDVCESETEDHPPDVWPDTLVYLPG